MKTKACSLLLLLAFSALVHADTVSNLVAQGCPSPDREWQAKDYTAFKELLVKKTLPLPRLESESGRAVLHRLVDTENLSFHHNRNLPLETRFPDLMNLMDGEKSIMMLYFRAANAGEKVEKELANLLVFQLAVASAAVELTEEFIPTIPKDEKYEIRMEGFAKMKSGLTTVLDGAVTSLSERAFYSDESVAKMVRGIHDYYPRFASLLPETSKTEFRVKIRDMLAREKNPVVKRELIALIDAMKVEQGGGAPNVGQPIRSETNSTPSAAGSRR
jgi:hypothetical protein